VYEFIDNTDWLTVPAGVSVCECVAIAEPLNVSAGTVTF
jgi:hypothetical protein